MAGLLIFDLELHLQEIYKVTDIFRLAIANLLAHAVRSSLTVLGIVFGVWSVIAMLAITEGFARKSQAELGRRGSDNIIVESIKPPMNENASQSTQNVANYGLTYEDVQRLSESIPQAERCTVVHKTTGTAFTSLGKAPVSLLGTEPSYLSAARLVLQDSQSRFITGADMLRRRNVCVITAGLARRLFGPKNPLNKTMRVGKEQFTVVGILERAAEIRRLDASVASVNQVIIPLTTDRQRLGTISATELEGSFSLEKIEVSQVIIKMADENAVLRAAKMIKPLLDRFHDREDFEIDIPLEKIETLKQQAKIWKAMFLAIAAVSLVVGGIGIMNIMLASVTERTREIGIRRALGAKKRDIVVQFLVESVTLTSVGGVLGILVGAFVIPVIVQMAVEDLKAVVEWPTLVVPFTMALIVGLISGVYPAMRAANFDPIVALRHE